MKKQEEKLASSLDIKSNKRKTIKTLALSAGGIGLTAPTQWATPVINSVVLPAHAATTDSGGDGGGGTTMAPFSGEFSLGFDIFEESGATETLTDEALIAQSETSPLDWLISTAQANGSRNHICINVNGNSYTADLQDKAIHYTQNGVIGASPTDMIVACNDEVIDNNNFQLSVDAIAADQMSVDITLLGFGGKLTRMYTVPFQDCDFRYGCRLDP